MKCKHIYSLVDRELLSKFTTNELMRWKDLCEEYEPELSQAPENSTAGTVFSAKSEDGKKRWKDLKIRVVEHVCICH